MGDMKESSEIQGLEALVAAAVPKEVRTTLEQRLFPSGAEAGVSQANLLQSLAKPPSTVTLRLTSMADQQELDERLRRLLKEGAGAGPGVEGEGEGEGPDEQQQQCFEVLPLSLAGPPCCWLDCPEARVVRATSSSSWPTTTTTPTGLPEPAAAAAAAAISSPPSSSRPAVVDLVLDAACGMAVLRGADVFCMGVMAASRNFAAGDRVRLAVTPEGGRVPNRGSLLLLSAAAAAEEGGFRACGAAITIGEGVALLPRHAVFASGAKGVAVRITARERSELPLAPMNDVLADDRLGRSVILQQLPSCATARVLRPVSGERVLDMCAAPGGKTTHLAQLMGNAGAGLVACDRSMAKARRIEALCRKLGFSAVKCLAADSRLLCDGSPHSPQPEDAREAEGESTNPAEDKGPEAQRKDGRVKEAADTQAKLDTTRWPQEAEDAFLEALKEHGSDRFRGSKRIYKAVIAKVGRDTVDRVQVNARLRQARHSEAAGEEGPLEAATTSSSSSSSFPEASFDKILLDPPCSALGQRPLLRWGKTYQDILDHQSYQQQFLRTAARLLRVGGELVFSTCTLTLEENEDNVRWALDNLPLELLNAQNEVLSPDAGEDAREALAGLGSSGLSEEQRRMVLRFNPHMWDVGFFAAKFRRVDRQAQTSGPIE